jgi:hypothetical protein
MRMSFRKVPIQTLQENFFSFGGISHPWLWFLSVLSSLDDRTAIRGPKSCYKKNTLDIDARNDKGLNRGYRLHTALLKVLYSVKSCEELGHKG